MRSWFINPQVRMSTGNGYIYAVGQTCNAYPHKRVGSAQNMATWVHNTCKQQKTNQAYGKCKFKPKDMFAALDDIPGCASALKIRYACCDPRETNKCCLTLDHKGKCLN